MLVKRFKNLFQKVIRYSKNPIKEAKKALFERKEIKKALLLLAELKDKPKGNPGCIIFSKDRPLQLYALLKSLQSKTSSVNEVLIIYNCGNTEYEQAYEELFRDFRELITTSLSDDQGFKSALLEALSLIKSEKVFFLVDDIIFTEEVDFSKISNVDLRETVFSLRLGKEIDFCYMMNSSQPLPDDFIVENFFGKWIWERGKHDWNYPLSVDGHLFSKNEIAIMTRHISFKAPNSYEAGLQVFNKIYKKRKGQCFKKSVLFNNPCNKVQTEILDNNSGELDSSELLKKWQLGLEINLLPFDGLKNRGVHEEKELSFIKRTLI